MAVTTQQYESLAQAAQRTGLSTRTLRRRIAAGLLPAFVSGRRTIRLKVEDVDRMMKPVIQGLMVG
ncbi:MAG: helix-turn-helix domain-containing protein [Propionibacteriaceae bacterium]|jgi:excisionase family DNA binding protein|nr:helix-turn-helix domain-containing protein [Propionibacteriaceae bacterium]